MVLDYGDLMIESDSKNYGTIHLGGGGDKLLIFFENFTKIIGYTICDYKSVVINAGAVSCKQLDED